MATSARISNDRGSPVGEGCQTVEMTSSGTPEAVTIRVAARSDAAAIADVEAEARTLLRESGMHLDALALPDGFEESVSWDLALVAEAEGQIIGMARCSDLGAGWLGLDQVSVRPAHARQGVGRRLLTALVAQASQRGFRVLTGTTFRAVPFNAPFYAGLDVVEDSDPHPAMAQRRQMERELGVDNFGPRLVMRLTIDHPRS